MLAEFELEVMNGPKIVLAASAAFFLLGTGAVIGVVVTLKTRPPVVAAAPAPGSPGNASAPEAGPPAPARSLAPAAPLPLSPATTPSTTNSPQLIVPPRAVDDAQPTPPPSPEPLPSPSPTSPPPSPRPMRPLLGLSVGDVDLLHVIDLGSRSISVGERAPKITSVGAGTPAGDAALRVDDRIFAVDGKPVDSAAQFEAAFSAKTAPGEVVLRTGKTYHESQDVKIVFK